MRTRIWSSCNFFCSSSDSQLGIVTGCLFLGAVLTLTGCSKTGADAESLFSSQLPASQVTFATIHRRINDPELAQAALLARKSWPVFVRAWMRRRQEPGTSFGVKVAVKEGDVTEHFWLEVTELRGDLISGKHDCDGVDLAGVHRGDASTVKVREIEDWLVSDSKVAFGGFSVIILTKASIARENNLDSPDPKEATRARELLISHWRKLAEEAKTPGDLALSTADISTYSQYFLLQKLLRGNIEHELSERELVTGSVLPPEVIEALWQFRKAREAATKKS